MPHKVEVRFVRSTGPDSKEFDVVFLPRIGETFFVDEIRYAPVRDVMHTPTDSKGIIAIVVCGMLV